jgi:hypothetical protein
MAYMNKFAEFKKPINLISIILGIGGIVLSIIFYLKEHKIKEISYLQNGKNSLIFDSKSSTSSIKLYEKDTIPITQNVYLLTGTIWNSGDIPIMQDDIRIPIFVDLDNRSKILNYKILKQRDSAVSNFSLRQISNNSLQLNWKYFDPSFGITFQLIYQSNYESEFKLSGKILGIHSFTYLKEDQLKKSYIWSWDTAGLLGYLIFTLFMAVYSKDGKAMRIVFWIISIGLLLVLLAKIYIYFKYLHLNPEI